MNIHRNAHIVSLALVSIATLVFSQPARAATLTANSGGMFTFSQDLRLWDQSADVLQLQKFLNVQKFFIAQSGSGSPGNETTLFGPLTYQALVKFQAAQGLPATGFFGPLTRDSIAKLTNSTTPPVTGQQTLTQLLAELNLAKEV